MKECIEDKRLKEIVLQLERVIHILCDRKAEDAADVLSKYTNISQEEWCSLRKVKKEE